GRELYRSEPEFRAAVDECVRHLDPGLPRPLLDVMFADAGSHAAGLLERTGFAQPALFALAWGLLRMWAAWGVRPDAVLGPAVGGIAAAAAAGVLSLADACALVAARARLMDALPAGGAMWAVEATADEAAGLLAGQDEVALAAINGPRQVV